MTAQRERLLLWEACYNARDLGGYETSDGRCTRWGAIVRADTLSRLTPAGLAALRGYGVRTVVDLRSAWEIAGDPNPFGSSGGAAQGPRYLNLPLIDEDNADATSALHAVPRVGDGYQIMLDKFGANIAKIMRTIADAPDGGVLVHCFAGKDRTGLVSALLLSVAGVPHETVVQDYALTGQYLQPWVDAELTNPDYPVDVRDRLSTILSSPAEAMDGALTYLRERWGGADPYLRHVGVSDEHLHRLRRRLLE
jgi:protein-tyrosine phosphatase